MNTNRITIYVLTFAIVLITIAASSYLKNSVYRLERELGSIKREIQVDKESIHILNAEWAKMNNPARLRNLAKSHTKLDSIKGEQIINYSELPFNYESGKDKKETARKNIAEIAKNNRNLKKMANNVR